MTPKAKTWEDLETIRDRRGYVPSKGSDLDHSPVYKRIESSTETGYEGTLRIWNQLSDPITINSIRLPTYLQKDTPISIRTERQLRLGSIKIS
jgi:hypothetical protein